MAYCGPVGRLHLPFFHPSLCWSVPLAPDKVCVSITCCACCPPSLFVLFILSLSLPSNLQWHVRFRSKFVLDLQMVGFFLGGKNTICVYGWRKVWTCAHTYSDSHRSQSSSQWMVLVCVSFICELQIYTEDIKTSKLEITHMELCGFLYSAGRLISNHLNRVPLRLGQIALA